MDATVLPLLRLPGRIRGFTYHVPAGLSVTPGDLVVIPFRNTTVRGVVWDLAPILPEAEKSILRLLIGGVVSPVQHALFSFCAEYYAASLPTLCKTTLPSFPLRGPETNLQTLKIPKPSGTRTPETTYIAYRAFQPAYTEIARLLDVRSGMTLGIFPTFAALDAFLRHAPRIQKHAVLVESQMPAARRRDVYERIRTGRVRSVLTTKAGLFSPFPYLHRIVIADDENDAHKQYDQQPFYDTRTLAEQLTKETGASLFRFTQSPRVEAWYMLAHKRARLRRLQAPTPRHKPELINIRGERHAGNTSLLSEALADALAKKRNGPALLYLNKKPAEHQEGASRGIDVLLFELRERYPNAKISTIAATENVPSISVLAHADIIVTTERFLHAIPVNISLRLVAAIDIDRDILRPNWRAREHAFHIGIALRNHALFSKAPFFIQTRMPADPFFFCLKERHWPAFYTSVLQERREYLYPPFTALTRILIPARATDVEQHYHALQNRLPTGVYLSPLFRGRGQNAFITILREPARGARLGSALWKWIPPGWKIDIDPLDLE